MGDVIYTTYGHYMVVSSVSGGIVKVTDCNFSVNCLIRWDADISDIVAKKQIKWIMRCSEVLTYASGVEPLKEAQESALLAVMSKRANEIGSYTTQIYLIEGYGDDLSANGRGSAICVVVKNGTIVFTNTSCATLPDQPFHAQSNPDTNNPNNTAAWDDQPNVVDGVYSVVNVSHSGYPALKVVSPVVYRIHSKSCGGGTNGEIIGDQCGSTTSGGIHIHKKSSNECEVFTTSENGSNTGWVNSSGCAIIPSSAWNSFASAVGFTGGTKISSTCVIYDRLYAYENVPLFKAYMLEKYTDDEGYAFDAGYYDETAVRAICGSMALSATKGQIIPRIILQPADQCVQAGQSATFTLLATGDNLTYQWYIDRNDGAGWCKLKGSTGTSYVTSVTELDNDGYQYRCVITDAYGNQLTSDVAVLRVVLDLPNTGDASAPMLWLAMCMLSVLGIAFMFKRRVAK